MSVIPYSCMNQNTEVMKTYPIALFFLVFLLLTVPDTRLTAEHYEEEYEPDYPQMVIDVFDDLLDRSPTRREMRKYSDLADYRQYDYEDLERRIHDDYDVHSRERKHVSYRRVKDYEIYRTRRWVEADFEKHVGRLPDEYEMQEYCEYGIDENLSEWELECLIRDDYQGIRESYWNDRNYHYDFPRYTSVREAEIIVEEAYQDYLGRSPERGGMRNYVSLMMDEGWPEKRIRENIKNSREAFIERNKRVVEKAFEDLLDRSPSSRERDDYLEEMYDRHWDEGDLRDDIRRGEEFQFTRPNRMIEEAYREVLLREADSSTYEGLRREIVKHGWSLDRFKKHLLKSDEYKNVTIPMLVRKAYLEVFGREPDPAGERGYIDAMRDGWSYEKLTRELRKSDEYRTKRR